VARLRTVFRCTDCGADAPKWVGRCPSCSAWNTLVEDVEEVSPAPVRAHTARPPVRIGEVDQSEGAPVPTGSPELDRVLGGGLVPGSVTLVGGEPGVGKSTLLLEVAARRAQVGGTVLYVTGEESLSQVRARAERLGAVSTGLWLASETSMPDVLAAIESTHPDLVVIDSIQTMADPDLGSAPGSVVQVRECAHRLVREAKERTVTVVLVGHVTKDGSLAGPRMLEHVVDTVLSFEAEHHALRLLRATKHRFGPTNELGLFEITESGLVPVADPSGLFLTDRRPGVAGSAVVAIVEGHRPLLVEVQALVSPSALAMPRRSAQGVDQGRLSMLLAVLEQRAGVPFVGFDVYVSVAGGVRLTEPGSDLGLCLALASARLDRSVAATVVACGEVGLVGELRSVTQMPRRLTEAARKGFTRAVVPASSPNGVEGIDLCRAASLSDALVLTGLGPSDKPAG
jgi:DNA repair protein RadA/Sms